MPEIYADWKSLKPLTDSVPVGTKCVVIGKRHAHGFMIGQIVARSDSGESTSTLETYSDGKDYWWLSKYELALLPADYQAAHTAEPAKVERKIVHGFCDNLGNVHAVCDDGSIWWIGTGLNQSWTKLPPIPQD